MQPEIGFPTLTSDASLNQKANKQLSRYGIQDNELNWLTDYLFLRNQIVQFKGVLSEPNPVFIGVPQGSILGPLLLSLIHI